MAYQLSSLDIDRSDWPYAPMALGDSEFDWPFEDIDCSPAARRVLEAFWFQSSQRRPFKHDFPNMLEKEPEEFNAMFQHVADAVDKELEDR